MKYLIFLSILFLSAARSFAVGGDITGASIDPNGRDLLIYIQGLNTNGTYNLGLGSNNAVIPNFTKVYLTVARPGNDDTGTQITTNRTVWGVTPVNQPYPFHAYYDETYDASTANVKVRICMDTFIFTGDSITLTASGGFYAEGGTNANSVSSQTVTNSSTLQWADFSCIGNYTQPSWERITNSTYTFSTVGFHGSGQAYRPVRVTKHILTGETGASVTNTILNWTIRRDLREPLPSGEAVSTFDLSGFTDHEQLRFDYQFFPWEGDTNAMFDTRRNTYTGITPMPCAITNFLDRANNYAPGIAVVDPVWGTNTLSSGIRTTIDPTTITSNYWFATLAAAANAMTRYNQTNGTPTHADVGGGVIYATSNVFSFAGGTFSSNTTPKCVLTIKPYPGHTVALTNNTGTRHVGMRIKFEDITLGFVGSEIALFGQDYTWFQRCRFNSSSSGPFQSTLMWVTDSTAPLLTQGFRGVSTGNQNWMLRNVDLTGFNNNIHIHLVQGCYRTTTNGPNYGVFSDLANLTAPGPDYSILYNNYLAGFLLPGSSIASATDAKVAYKGLVWAQNVFEIDVNGTAAGFSWGGATTTNTYSTNFIIINNTLVGNRVLTGYNDTGSLPIWRRMWTMRNNVFELNGFKSDNFTGASGGDSNRIGNWDIMYQVNCSGNEFPETAGGPAAPGTFHPYFAGVDSYHPATGAFFTLTTNTWGYLKYVRKASVQLPDTNSTAGGGDYRFQSDSPVWHVPSHPYLPFDQDGYSRGGFDPPGAYTAGASKKGMMFQ